MFLRARGSPHSPGHPASPKDSPDVFVIGHQGHGTAWGCPQTTPSVRSDWLAAGPGQFVTVLTFQKDILNRKTA